MNIFDIDKSLNCCPNPSSCSSSTFLFLYLFLSISKWLSLFLFLFFFGQTAIITNLFQTGSFELFYSHNSSFCINTKNKMETINQEFLKQKDKVSPFIYIYFQKKLSKLPTRDILMIDDIHFNSLVQRAFSIKDIYIFRFSIYNIENILAPSLITNPAKKQIAKYYEFFDIFSRIDLNQLLLHCFYNHKLSLMKRKTLSW